MVSKILSAIGNGLKAIGIGLVKGSVVIFVDMFLLGVTSILCSWWYGIFSGYLLVDTISFSIVTVQLFMIGALMTIVIVKADKKICKFIDKSLGKKEDVKDNAKK